MSIDVLERNKLFREISFKGLAAVKDRIPEEQFSQLTELVSQSSSEDKMAHFNVFNGAIFANAVVYTKKSNPQYVRDNNGYLIEKSIRNFIPLFPDSYNLIEYQYIKYSQVMSPYGRYLRKYYDELLSKIEPQHLIIYFNAINEIIEEHNKAAN